VKCAVLQRTASSGILPEFLHRGFDGGAVIGMEQFEAGAANHLFLGIAEDALDGWTGVTDFAVGVADAENVVTIFYDEAETLAGFAKGAVRRRGIGDFLQDATHQRPTLDIHRTDADRQRKLTAVIAVRGELQLDARRPLSRRLGVRGDLLEIFCAEKIGKQNIKVNAEQLIVAVAQKFFGLRVHQDDQAAAVDDQNGFRSGHEQGSGHSITEGKTVLSHSSFNGAK